MDFWLTVLIGLGLSADVFALSVVTGMTIKQVRIHHAILLALCLGAFHIIMPIIGWYIGVYVQKYISSFDHWVAAGMLCYIGGKMIYQSYQEDTVREDIFTVKQLLLLSFVTSLDAFFIGISFAIINGSILQPAIIIGCIAFISCLVGIYIGKHTKSLVGDRAEFFGGIVLVIIGIKILLDHLLL